MSEAMHHFGKLLVQAREEQGLSQLDVADIVDMDVRTIQAIEDGTGNPYMETTTEIIRKIHISPGVLFSQESIEDKLKMDRIYRELIGLAPEQMKIVTESAEAAKKWMLSHEGEQERNLVFLNGD